MDLVGLVAQKKALTNRKIELEEYISNAEVAAKPSKGARHKQAAGTVAQEIVDGWEEELKDIEAALARVTELIHTPIYGKSTKSTK